MTKTDKFNKAKNIVGGTVRGALIGAVVIPFMGLLAHAGSGITNTFVNDGSEDYSLKNRFETAYKFDVPHKKSHYDVLYQDSAWNPEIATERYLAHPAATYPAHLVFALLGGIAGAKRKEH